MDGGKGGTRGGVGSLPRDAAREGMRESASEKGYQMDKTAIATGVGIALAVMYGWVPLAWAACRLMGWL